MPDVVRVAIAMGMKPRRLVTSVRSHVAGLALLASCAQAACGAWGKQAAPQKTLPVSQDVTALLVQAASNPGVNQGRTRGRMFVLHADAGAAGPALWMRCGARVLYRYESLTTGPVTVVINSRRDVRSSFPFWNDELDEAVSRGMSARVTFFVSGRFVLDQNPSARDMDHCSSGTHYVQAILLGSYRVDLLRSGSVIEMPSGHPGGAASGNLSRFVARADTAGDGSACIHTEPQPLRLGCAVPLAFTFKPFSRTSQTARFGIGDIAGIGEVPDVLVLPRGLAGRPGTPDSDGPEGLDCLKGYARSGDASRDLSQLVDACGLTPDMKPWSPVQTEHQRQSDPPDAFVFSLEAGKCYRAFAVGGEGVEEIDTRWRGPGGALVAHDYHSGSWAVLTPESPFCIVTSGNYELVVSIEKGAGQLAVQLWQVP